MAVVSDQTIASAAVAAGFPRDQIATAVAVALAESGGNATAKNTANKNGTTDYGLWQINSIHKADLAGGDWTNPRDNARMAFAVYSRAGKKWTPWYAWRDGKHLPFMARGVAAAAKAGAGDQDDDGGVFDTLPTSLPNPLEGMEELAGLASSALRVVTDRDTWIRVGMFALGGVLLAVAIIGLIWTLGGKSAAKTVVGAVNPVGKAGKVLKGVKGK